ncbi:MAG TPA: TetR family transcriptional regulator [Mycobacteriales bacterium]|nr:TetR family transcriptional regulator [Mycobacteriales bacterium]
MAISDGASPLRAVDGRVPGRRGLATRQRLLECTIDLLASTPYRDLKVTDITRAAGTSPATFYQYFVDIEAILLAIAEQTVEEGRQLADLITDRPWKGAAGVASAEGLVDGFLEFWRDHRATLRVVDLLSTEGDKRFRHQRVLMLNAMTKALAAEIAQLQGDGKDSGVEPMAMAGALIGMLVNLAGHRAGFEAWDIRFDEVREAMVRLIYWGVTGPKLPRSRG